MLATSMHAQPGVYALLLGSGVSSGAGIATGWGVVTTLVREVAALVDLETDKDNAATGAMIRTCGWPSAGERDGAHLPEEDLVVTEL